MLLVSSLGHTDLAHRISALRQQLRIQEPPQPAQQQAMTGILLQTESPISRCQARQEVPRFLQPQQCSSTLLDPTRPLSHERHPFCEGLTVHTAASLHEPSEPPQPCI
ncbi:hypothetical protein NDU88_003215 [Pleurodeles waltl]|uniref:Uncharacterized protein n=1 Tax=Pleurodeles waltl TaxID=8319 RepID=A0AAV7TMT3_PLEWA|nr:hypothetical protein NDU88_003215 [Pleurodeles waltl]